MLELSIAIGENKQLEKVSVKNWKKADWDKIREKLRNTTWPTTEDELTADEAWGALRNTLDQLIEEHVPSCIFNSFVTRKKKKSAQNQLKLTGEHGCGIRRLDVA